MILSNQARCLKCGDELYSAYTHDYKECSCGEIFVDGGRSYLRHGYNSRDNYMDLSIVMDDYLAETLTSSLDWCEENGRNLTGQICAIARCLRDCGYEIRGFE